MHNAQKAHTYAIETAYCHNLPHTGESICTERRPGNTARGYVGLKTTTS